MPNQRGPPRRNAAGSLSFHFVEMARLQDSVEKNNVRYHSPSSNNSKRANSFAAVVANNNSNSASCNHQRQMSPGLVAGYSGTGVKSATNNQKILSKNPTRHDSTRDNGNFDVCLPDSNHEEDGEKSISYNTRSSSNPYFANLSSTNLYIRGLAPETTDDKLQSMCERYGKIVSTKAIMDKQTNLCKGYGFVDFETAESAERALKGLANQSVQVQMAKQQEQDPSNLYLANLPVNWTEADLCALLNKFGAVISTRVLKTSQGQSRGVGFARMDSKETCETIISMYNGKKITPDGDPLLVKFADCGKKIRKPLGAAVGDAGQPPTSAAAAGHHVLDGYHGVQSAYDLCDSTGRSFLQQTPHHQMLAAAAAEHQFVAAAAARSAAAAAGQNSICWNYLPNIVPQTINYSTLVNNYDSAALAATTLAGQLSQMSLAGGAYGAHQNAYAAAYQAYAQQQQPQGAAAAAAAYQHYYSPNAAYLPVDMMNGNRSNMYECAYNNSNLEHQQNGD